jgi:hypothetical protein
VVNFALTSQSLFVLISSTRNAAPQHGFEVLVFAAKHDLPDLANEAVKFCLKVPIAKAFDRLNARYFKGFVSCHLLPL